MGKQTSKNIQVGIMVIAGLASLFTALYIVGSQKNMFGSGFTISANFNDVGGLMTGNNVRFAGIDVGTVKSVDIVNDSLVAVSMVIKKDARQYIRKNAVAKIGTDGLMGNKLVNISNVSEPAATIENGDVLLSIASAGMDEVTGKLGGTAEDVAVIMKNIRSLTESDAFSAMPATLNDMSGMVANLKAVSARLEQSKALWNTLSDPKVAKEIRQSVSQLTSMAGHADLLAADVQSMIADIKAGKGAAGLVVSDEQFAQELQLFMTNLNKVSGELLQVSSNLEQLTTQLTKNEGIAGKIINDPMVGKDFEATLHHLRNSSEQLEEHMEALKKNFLFRRYYRKQEKNK
jgi:phospholipid/cholesterol/gamma-HCH transport system substrate-binding protein